MIIHYSSRPNWLLLLASQTAEQGIILGSYIVPDYQGIYNFVDTDTFFLLETNEMIYTAILNKRLIARTRINFALAHIFRDGRRERDLFEKGGGGEHSTVNAFGYFEIEGQPNTLAGWDGYSVKKKRRGDTTERWEAALPTNLKFYQIYDFKYHLFLDGVRTSSRPGEPRASSVTFPHTAQKRGASIWTRPCLPKIHLILYITTLDKNKNSTSIA
ncbi:hypothetical protein ACJX0J_026786, partial [Zea mays]